MDEAVALARPIVEKFEGFAKARPDGDGDVDAYLDSVGVPTIGWGCTGPDIKPGTKWTRQQCVERLEHELMRALTGALRSSPGLSRDPKRAAAILDFCFNLGAGAYQGSTLRRKVNAGEWQSAANEARKWCNAGGRKLAGLVLRREVEALMLEGR